MSFHAESITKDYRLRLRQEIPSNEIRLQVQYTFSKITMEDIKEQILRIYRRDDIIRFEIHTCTGKQNRITSCCLTHTQAKSIIKKLIDFTMVDIER